jgi:hypothetical protein
VLHRGGGRPGKLARQRSPARTGGILELEDRHLVCEVRFKGSTL